MHPRFHLFLIFLFSFFPAQAAILVNAPDPYPQNVMGDTNLSVYYAGNFTGSPSVANSINTSKGYRFIDTDSNADSNLIYLDISTNSTFTVGAGQSIAVSLKATGGNEILLTGASIATGTSAPVKCSNGASCLSDFKGAYYTAGSTLRVSFLLSDLCGASATGSLCSSGAVVDTAASTKTQGIEINFGVVSSSPVPVGSSVATATGAVRETITLGITDINPTTTCPSGSTSNFYFPGDGQIYLFASNFGISAAGGIDVQFLITMALENAATAFDFQAGGLSANSIVHYTPADTPTEEITGFTNTTNGPGGDHQYAMVVQAQNKAGLVSASTSKCDFNGVQSQDITGILKESKCFIATAAYQDGRAAPVMMLRKFRDRILSRSSFGREFIKKYYEVSPALALWAWNKPWVRSIALRILAPLEAMAWLTLQVSEAADPSPGIQPYIDRIKKAFPEETRPDSSEESYTIQQKKKLEEESDAPTQPRKSYSEKLKKVIIEEDGEESSASYIEQEKLKLPPEETKESVIQKVKEGRDEKLGFGVMPDIHYAAGFKLGISQGMQVTVANGVHTFTDIYGSGFKPEFLIHYEYQLFHSENLGSFGIGTDFGLAVSGGKGRLQFTFGGSSNSVTGFSFVQVPLLVNGNYRFNLLRILRPYVSAGAGTILYSETREDSRSDKRGYTFVYHGTGGVSLLLDFLDSKTRRDSYLSYGFQHTYWFVEYLYLNSFKSNVAFKRAGIYSGFMFEF